MKRNIIMVLLFILVLGGALLAKENTILKVKVQTANVRSEPDASAPIIAQVTAGTLLEVAGKEGAWYEVTVNDKSGKAVTGYIHTTVVEVIGEDEEEAEVKPRAAVRREAPRARAAKEFAGGGVKLMGGMAMANLNISETIPPEAKKTSKMGFMGGLGFESGGMIAFEVDLLYSPGGAVFKAVDPAQKGKLAISGTGISLPIMLKVRFLPGTSPYILAGGEIGYILNQKVVVTANDGTTTEEDITDEINRLFYGLVFGGGVELKAGGMNLLLEARYRLGLSNLAKDPDPGQYVKATALMFLLGVKF
ncbi:MAG: outer membrane beta-barrel protein [Acidobacteria bacterium]|nr:outer membrane beta-barrel protein [Acidobacteriota bacterium]MBU4306912.1 outer membrane beta-barrel protein [Acidobacteriota bacterium]MBU4404368.1 outer membrane beta-barrel protein [Acidobacteriota bacterium]MCG2812486.1 outer membrane beta-barrel protein [Candidatus Aminicenantes bacterium]